MPELPSNRAVEELLRKAQAKGFAVGAAEKIIQKVHSSAVSVFESSCKINQRELSPEGLLEYRKNHAAIILQMAVTSPTTVEVVKAQADDDEQALKWILEALTAVGGS